MKLVLLTHPEFIGSHSQAHFARMLLQAYRARGHDVELRQPTARVRRQWPRGPLAKWAGYIDQYLLFPPQLQRAVRADPVHTLYVFCDQALGPWMPGLAHLPHVVHCHDLLALRSALDLEPMHPTGATGRLYQRWIRSGFRRARHFISISQRTRDDLHRWGGVSPQTSEVVYNGLIHDYRPMPPPVAAAVLEAAGLTPPDAGFVLHVGGGQWYKNSEGVVALYGQMLRHLDAGERVPQLLMISPPPSAALSEQLAHLPPRADVRFANGLAPEVLQALYSRARFLLFPSHAEGFGWPIAEGLACGCPVVTTADAPMTEVGGEHAHYLPPLGPGRSPWAWAEPHAPLLLQLLRRSEAERNSAAEAGRLWARRFDPDHAISRYLRVYEQVLAREQVHIASPRNNEVTP